MELKSDAAAQFPVSPSSGSKVVMTSWPIGHRSLTPDCVSMVGDPEVNRLFPRRPPGNYKSMCSIRALITARGMREEKVRILARINTGLVGVGLEQDEDGDAGDGDVEPNGESEARDAAVHGEAAREREKERGDQHGQRDDRKDDVAGQNRKG